MNLSANSPPACPPRHARFRRNRPTGVANILSGPPEPPAPRTLFGSVEQTWGSGAKILSGRLQMRAGCPSLPRSVRGAGGRGAPDRILATGVAGAARGTAFFLPPDGGRVSSSRKLVRRPFIFGCRCCRLLPVATRSPSVAPAGTLCAQRDYAAGSEHRWPTSF